MPTPAPRLASAETRSESILGKSLEGRRDEVVLVSKFGHTPEGPKLFTVDWFWESLDASLSRLRTDYLDVLLLHNPPSDIYAGTDPLWAAMGEATAVKILERGARGLGLAIGNAANLVNPARVVLGGGVAKSGARWWQVVRRTAQATALPEAQFDIVPAALGDDAPLWGAIALMK